MQSNDRKVRIYTGKIDGAVEGVDAFTFAGDVVEEIAPGRVLVRDVPAVRGLIVGHRLARRVLEVIGPSGAVEARGAIVDIAKPDRGVVLFKLAALPVASEG
ncbi:hypothetical protein L6R52_16985 [Myxococcota bacterium]|nr:hypothetical protein [Myxococcota bacterium]